MTGNLVDLRSVDAHLGILLAILSDALLLGQQGLQVDVLLIQKLHVAGDLLVLGVGREVELLPQVYIQVDELIPLHLELIGSLGNGLLCVL